MVAIGDYGLDYAWDKPPIAAMKANNYKFAMRYLSWLPNGKVIDKPEYDSLLANDIAIGLNWEYDKGDQQHGAPFGHEHGAEAYRQATALGAPKGSGIYFSADWDVSVAILPVLKAYWDAANQELSGYYRFGVYGGYRAVSYAITVGYLGWQTYAWSYGQWDLRAHIRQIRNGIYVGGANVDRDQLFRNDAGLIIPGAPAPIPPATPALTLTNGWIG